MSRRTTYIFVFVDLWLLGYITKDTIFLNCSRCSIRHHRVFGDLRPTPVLHLRGKPILHTKVYLQVFGSAIEYVKKL